MFYSLDPTIVVKYSKEFKITLKHYSNDKTWKIFEFRIFINLN